MNVELKHKKQIREKYEDMDILEILDDLYFSGKNKKKMEEIEDEE